MSKIQLSSLVLKSGSHASPEAGMCVMEAVAYFAKEPHSAAPDCACPVLTVYMQVLNDQLNEDERQLLKPYIKRLIGTRDGNSQKRADILAWASIVKFTPHCLELVGLNDHAEAMRSIEKFNWSAAWSAAWSAGSAAESAAESAARSAARSAGSAAESAAWSAAESAARSAAWSAAESAESADKKNARKIVVDMALEALEEALRVYSFTSETVE